MSPARSILLIGNFHAGRSHSIQVCHGLASRLSARGWAVLTASAHRRRVPRLLDMVATSWSRRRSYQVAYVEVFSGPSFLWAEAVAWILRGAGKPYVLALHGGNLPEFARRFPVRVRTLLESASIVTAPSSYLATHMSRYCGKIRLIPNALDLASYETSPRDTVGPRLIWLRAFHSIYNPSLAVKTLAILAREFPQVSLIMIGPDKGDGSLGQARELAKDLGADERIEWVAGVPKPEVPMQLRRGDIFLNTTRVDNTPVSVIEAMACGLCVVSTNVGGMPHLLEHESDGLLVPPDDPVAMAAAIRRVLCEPELARGLRAKARAKAEGFDWGIVMDAWEATLLEATRGGVVGGEPT